MARINITSTNFNTSRQSIQQRYIRIELLNYNFQTVDVIDGRCTTGNITIDANADIRRTGNVTLVIDNSSFNVESGGQIWLDKYLRVWVGTYSLISHTIDYVNCGLFIIDAPSYNYDPATNSLSLSLLDLMAKLTGVRNGYLPGVPVVLKAGESIREALIDTLALGGFTRYIIGDPPEDTIPNDLEFSQGATVYDLLSGLRDIYPNYEIFFDVDGVFWYQPIPTGEGDSTTYVDDTLWNKIVMSEKIDVDFQNVKNVIEVYGRTHDPAGFASSVSVDQSGSSSIITLTIAEVTEYTEGIIYGFEIPANTALNNVRMNINQLEHSAQYAVYDTSGKRINIPANDEPVYYCAYYHEAAGNEPVFIWLGHLQAYGYAEDTNPQSPFYVESTVGRIRLPLYGGEYENCYSDDLAQQRAEYELWLHTNMNNTLTLTCTPVPWLDVNVLVGYTSKRTEEYNEYLIKTISYGLAPSSSMTLTLMKFYAEPSS